MKKLFLILLCALVAQIGFSQEKTKKNITELSFEVDGVCGMCKERIEGAAMRTKGVKMAEWDRESHILTVVYKPAKASEEDIHEAINAVGHDTEKQRAKDEVYEKIHPCCHYRDQKVMEDPDQDDKAGQ